MDPSASVFPHASEMHHFHGSSSYSDPDIIEVTQSSWIANQKRKRKQQVVPPEIIDVDEDDDPDGVIIIGETNNNSNNNNNNNNNNNINNNNININSNNNSNLPNNFSKVPIPSPFAPYLMDCNNQMKDYGLTNIAGPSNTNPYFPPLTPNPNFQPNPNFPPNPNSQPKPSLQDFSFEDYDYFEDDEDYFDEDIEDMVFDNFSVDANSNFNSNLNFNLALKFDNLDIPTGIEAPVPWPQNSSVNNNINNNNISNNNVVSKQPKVMNDEIYVNYKNFKQFDTVSDHSDHYFIRSDSKAVKPAQKPSKQWAKRIQNDWKLLEKDLPESIFVRVYEERMDLMRACIIGPAGTPYHDGLFFFDVYFPPNYPLVPPMVHYHSGGLRLNPNLYACGKVCLSLLNTWAGSGCEKWNPANSTMLQVFVSVQALVLNAKPYFNEPGYAGSANTPHGEQRSLSYNENTFLLSCRTMLYSLRRPPKHFEHFVAGHFRTNGHAILVACKAYMDGAQVGCLSKNGVQDVDEGDKSCSLSFKTDLKKLFDDLLMELTVKGADCDAFINNNNNNNNNNNQRGGSKRDVFGGGSSSSGIRMMGFAANEMV